MKKLLILGFAFLMALVVPATAVAQSQMSDKQVLEYVKKGLKSGKNQTALATELAVRGVDAKQIARVKSLYEKQSSGGGSGAGAAAALAGGDLLGGDVDRSHSFQSLEVDEIEEDDWSTFLKYLERPTVEWTRAEGVDPMARWKAVGDTTDLYPVVVDSLEVFGRNLFFAKTLNFNPSENIPTPKDYVLGAGDEVIIDIFGATQNSMSLPISPDGYVYVEDLGPVYLAGKTLASAKSYLKNRLAAIYSGLDGTNEASDIQISLGQIRSIQVTVVGDVQQPGTYLVPSVSTAFHALYKSGGVLEPGSIRNIKVMRNNKQVAAVDIYDLLVYGSRKNEVRLEEGDVVLVEPYEKLIRVSGAVKRPMLFELKANETLADAIKFAGGFGISAYQDAISVTRRNNGKFEVYNVEASQFGSFVLNNGDEVAVRSFESRFENRVSVNGAVQVPGVYELSGVINTVKKLVAKAGGLQADAFGERAVIRRRNNDKTLETVAIDLAGVLSGAKADVALKNNDELFVYSIDDISDRGTFSIEGEVANPGTFPFAENTTVQDLILLAGGMLRSSSISRIDVARLIVDNESSLAKNDIATYYTFSMENGYAVDGADKFVLEPYDVVIVRRSPSFVSNRMVRITGEVNFPGTYTLSKREERISDLIRKAGDLTDFAYIKGARLRRAVTAQEKEQGEVAASAGGNSSITGETYLVSFDMEKVMKNPGCVDDLVLRDGDVLDIPVFNNTVGVSGCVQVPTTVAFQKGMKKRALVNAAGGYKKGARKTKAYIIYMNGRVTKLKRYTTIEPGSQIYIPAKDAKVGQVERAIAISSSVATLGMTAVTIANLLK